MTTFLPPMTRRLFDASTYAVLSTVNADGSPQSSVVWIRRGGDELLMSTIRGRRKAANMARDPRVSLCAYDPADPFQYVEVRGTVTMVEEGGDELIDELSRAYTGKSWKRRPAEVRLVVRLTPSKVIERVSVQSPSYVGGGG
jgi:PPOX class probable F420-dependent enzyme